MAVKEIPNNPEAEQAVIGAMFLEKNSSIGIITKNNNLFIIFNIF